MSLYAVSAIKKCSRKRRRKGKKTKKHPNKFGSFRENDYLCTRFLIEALKGDPLAQSVEHNTFNVGVLGSSPKRITLGNQQAIEYQLLADFLLF